MPGSPLLVPFVKGLIVVSGTLGLLLTSGLVVQGLITWITRKENQEEGSPRVPPVDRRTRDVGMLVGKCENLLVVAFVLLNAYTALGLIFAAKTWSEGRICAGTPFTSWPAP